MRHITATSATRTAASAACGRARRRALAVVLAAGGALVAAQAAPDEAAHGAGQGYPVGDRASWYRPPHLVGSLTAMDRLFPTRRVAASGPVRPLPRADQEPAWPFVDDYLDRHPATGLLVLRDGRILFERYRYGRRAEDRFTTFSVAKTVVGLAVGIALAEGRIGSLDDPVDRYDARLADTAWAGVAIRHVLTMSSGVRFDETYDRTDTDIARLSRAWTRQQGSLAEALRRHKERHAPPGSEFRYASADTQVLAQVLVAATGRPLADYVGDRLWGPMGAEDDAAWVLDATGMEAGYCCLSARLRDWGRLGQLLLEGGERDGRAVVPADWVRASTTVREADRHLRPRVATPYLGYGHQVWILPDALGFALLGVRGQAIYVHPSRRLVMVQTAVWPSAREPALAAQRDAFWRALVRAAGTP